MNAQACYNGKTQVYWWNQPDMRTQNSIPCYTQPPPENTYQQKNLRDELAAAALPALIAKFEFNDAQLYHIYPIVKAAYQIADAMMKIREETLT